MTKKNMFSDLFPPTYDRDGSYPLQTQDETQTPTQSESINAAKERTVKQTSSSKSLTKNKDKEDPHYHGHRDRLRDRFFEGKGEALADYEVIEMLLFLGIPRKDVKPLAKDLLKKYENLPALMAADVEGLLEVKGMTKNAVCALKIVREAAQRMMRQDLMGKPILNSWQRLTDYLYASMAEEKREHFRIIFLDRKNNLIGDEVQQTGTVDQTPAYPREILKRALELSSTAIILVHNHPSGDPTPSAADIEMTKNVITAAKALDITVHDHVIVSRKGILSFKSEGLLQF